MKENDEWVIVDFKTLDKDKDTTEEAKTYSTQLKTYKGVWEKMSEDNVSKTELFFIRKSVKSTN